MLYILILIGALSLAMWGVINAKQVRDGNNGGTGWSSTFVMGGSFLAASFYMLILWIALWQMHLVQLPTNVLFWQALGITVLLNILFDVFRFKAYGLAPFAQVSAFGAISPVLTIITAWLIIGEKTTTGGIIGILLIAISIYFLNLKGNFGWNKIGEPFKEIWNNRGTRYAFFASIPPAVSIIFDKKAIVASDPYHFFFVCHIFYRFRRLVG